MSAERFSFDSADNHNLLFSVFFLVILRMRWCLNHRVMSNIGNSLSTTAWYSSTFLCTSSTHSFASRSLHSMRVPYFNPPAGRHTHTHTCRNPRDALLLDNAVPTASSGCAVLSAIWATIFSFSLFSCNIVADIKLLPSPWLQDIIEEFERT